MASIDWSVGRYERIAAQLLPAARVVVDRAAPAPGERVVDVGCGTGNAALLAAARGAGVTGVDPAPRLLELARQQAAEQALHVTFAPGEAAALPLPDDAADVTLSVFGVVFAFKPPDAAAEMARVTAPDGRIVLSAWIPEGAIAEAGRAAQAAVAGALAAPAGPPPFAWHDSDALAALFEPHGFQVEVEEHDVAFTAPSPSAFLDRESDDHPLAIARRAVLEPTGRAGALRDRMLSIYEAANEDPAAFRVTSRYIGATARRPPA
jgi:SAM-dependent methyltransferase